MAWTALTLAAGWAILTAVIGAWLTVIGDWYYALSKPGWKPPDWAFGPVWTTIFILASVAFYQAWVRSETGHTLLLAAYIVNGALNIFWNVLFFTWRRPDWALIETGFLWLSIIAMMAALAAMLPWTAALLVPYLVWVSIAWLLNLRIVQLNNFGATAEEDG